MSPDAACDVLVFRDDDVSVELQCLFNGVRFIKPWFAIETSTIPHSGRQFVQAVADRFRIVEIYQIVIACDFILLPAEHLAEQNLQ